MLVAVPKSCSYQLTPLGWPGRSNPGYGYSRNIELWGNFVAHCHNITIWNNQMLVKIRIALGFLFLKHTLKVILGNMVAHFFLISTKDNWLEIFRCAIQPQKFNFHGITPTWNAFPGYPGGVSWYKKRFWTAANMCDLGQQGDLYIKYYSVNSLALNISKLWHGFNISPILADLYHMEKIHMKQFLHLYMKMTLTQSFKY